MDTVSKRITSTSKRVRSTGFRVVRRMELTRSTRPPLKLMKTSERNIGETFEDCPSRKGFRPSKRSASILSSRHGTQPECCAPQDDRSAYDWYLIKERTS